MGSGVGGVMVGGRRRRGRTVVMAVLVVLAATAGVVGASVLRDRGTAEPAPEDVALSQVEVDQREAGEIAGRWLDAWAAKDWEGMRPLLADREVDAVGIHAEADRVLQITGATYTPGLPAVTGDRATVPFDAVWTLEGLGEVRFTTELELVRPEALLAASPSDDPPSAPPPSAPAGSEAGASEAGAPAAAASPPPPAPPPADTPWLVDWSYAALHPDLRPNGSFVRIREFPDRAPILAADGTPLAASSSDVAVGIEPQRLAEPQPVIDALVQHAGADPAAVAALLARSDLDPAGFYPVVSLPRDRFEEARPQLEPVPGIVFRASEERMLADPEVGRRIIGRVDEITAEGLQELGPPYLQGDQVGRSGIERVYERQLAGEPTLEAQIVDPLGLVESLAYREGRPGQPVLTTVDLGLQRAAEQAVTGTALPAALVVVDAGSGEIRAAANSPPEGAERALSGNYPPGSTFKVVTASALLASGATPATPVPCPSSAAIGGREIGNAGGFGLGTTTLEQAFARSCNTTFGRSAIDLGAEAMDAMAGTYGFDVAYDMGLPGAFGGSYPTPESDTELGASGIGQARVEASPAHMASVAAAAASGVWRAPHVIRGLPLPPEQPLPDTVPAPLRQMMRAVVTSGTGTAADVPGEPVIGKSGTAQYGSGDPLPEHAWFVAARGGLAVAAFVEGGGGGGRNAAPLVARFLSAVPSPAPPASPAPS